MDFNIILFDKFETLDVFGPVEIIGKLKEFYFLKYFSRTGGIIISSQGVEIMTQSWEKADKSGILFIPGGLGTRNQINNQNFMKELKDFIKESIYCITVCTGSGLVAGTGLLKGIKATSNKRAFEWACSIDKEVLWTKKARWVVDGKYYTSSGVSAGIDMALGFTADRFGVDKAQEIANSMEYIWNSDKDNDLFALE